MAWSAGQDVTAALLNANAPQEWTPYTPTLAAATLGTGGQLDGRYVQHGKTVHFVARARFGTGLSVGAGVNLSLPVARRAYASPNHDILCHAQLLDNGSNTFMAVGYVGASAATLFIIGASGVYTALSATAPFTWASGDQIWLNGTYEAA